MRTIVAEVMQHLIIRKLDARPGAVMAHRPSRAADRKAASIAPSPRARSRFANSW
jgi:hypothetical protein